MQKNSKCILRSAEMKYNKQKKQTDTKGILD